ncbi:MAG: DNA polymerase [Oscillospiraceae bacterium]|nr:DNA polymerase [Oscillospiraceae bacterium]
MHTLSIDIETRSKIDITKSWVYRYAEDPDFDILLFGVSVNGGPVTVYDLACGEKLPEEILEAIVSDDVTKYAYNASFERICISKWLGKQGFLNPKSWRCDMVWAAYNGLPLALAQVGTVLGLERQKMTEGRALIRYFCIPAPSDATDGMFSDEETSHFHSPADAPEKWALFKAYNKRDVEVEMAIQERLRSYPAPESVWDEYHQDQEINDRGIRIDRELVTQAIELDRISQARLMEKLKKLTGLENPNSVSQLKGYLEESGMQVESLGKKQVQAMLADAPGTLQEILELRLQSSKSSLKKYEAMKNAVCEDGRCRGMFQFYGANRSGRWAGRLIQLQNLPQNHMADLNEARELVKAGDAEMLELLYPSIPEVLSELIRTAFVPEAGKKFIVADFSAIEARVLAHLAGENWRAEVFRNGGDIYCASASQMFRVPVEKHGMNGHLRQKGKIAELALGYGGGVGALKAMGAIEMGLTEEELQPLVSMWREANPNIVNYWWKIDAAAKSVIRDHVPVEGGLVRFEYQHGMMFITLPSGRCLAYVKPKICENRYGGEGISYCGLTAQKKFERIESYGPKLVENITQAISRDILAHAMKTLRKERIVGHIHDEIILETEKDASVRYICEQMGRTPAWIPGLMLQADGYECEYYRKE